MQFTFVNDTYVDKEKSQRISTHEITCKKLSRKLHVQNGSHLLRCGSISPVKRTAKKVLDFDFFQSLQSFRLRGGNVIVNMKHCMLFILSLSCSGSQACIARSSVIKSLIAFTSLLLSLSLVPALCFCISLSLLLQQGESSGESRAQKFESFLE